MSWIAEAAARVEARRDALRRALGTSAARHLVCIDSREGSWVEALQRRLAWWAKAGHSDAIALGSE